MSSYVKVLDICPRTKKPISDIYRGLPVYWSIFTFSVYYRLWSLHILRVITWYVTEYRRLNLKLRKDEKNHISVATITDS